MSAAGIISNIVNHFAAIMVLADLREQETGIITKIKGRGTFRKRIMEMGFIKGKEVLVIRNAPLQDPIQYRIMNYEVSLRRSEAAMIEVIDQSNVSRHAETPDASNAFRSKKLHVSDRLPGNDINIALVGNPNCGKTTLFNFASNSREHVGNYSGVTVDAKTAEFKLGDSVFHLTDLPGSYSLSAYSPEEVFVRKHLIDNMPDVVINVIDSSNLERNLYLTTQLIDLDIKVVVALNMYDELQKTWRPLRLYSVRQNAWRTRCANCKLTRARNSRAFYSGKGYLQRQRTACKAYSP